MLTKQNFIDFLKDMNSYEKYKENIEKFHNLTIEDIWDKIVSGEYKTKNLIDAFFTWKHTPQGHTFWEAVNEAWDTLVEKDEKDAKKIPVYEVTYSRREVCKVFCPKITKSQRMNIENLIHDKYPNTEIWKAGDYLIAAEMIPSGLIKVE